MGVTTARGRGLAASHIYANAPTDDAIVIFVVAGLAPQTQRRSSLYDFNVVVAALAVFFVAAAVVVAVVVILC